MDTPELQELVDAPIATDNLVIASFVTGSGSSTLPVLICSRIRLDLRLDINALATIIILTVAIGVTIAAYLMLQQKIVAVEAVLDEQVGIWRAMIVVLDSGDHCPHHLRGCKP